MYGFKYRKVCKWNTENCYHNCHNKQNGLPFHLHRLGASQNAVMRPNGADGMANSIDPYQTVSFWFCNICSGVLVSLLRVVMVV